MDVNFEAPFELCSFFLILISQKVIRSVCDQPSFDRGNLSRTWLGHYSVRKSCADVVDQSLCKRMANPKLELKNVICPGWSKTKFSEKHSDNDKMHVHDHQHNWAIKQLETPRRNRKPWPYFFLASNASSYTTGAVFTADGGFTIKFYTTQTTFNGDLSAFAGSLIVSLFKHIYFQKDPGDHSGAFRRIFFTYLKELRQKQSLKDLLLSPIHNWWRLGLDFGSIRTSPPEYLRIGPLGHYVFQLQCPDIGKTWNCFIFSDQTYQQTNS